MGRNGQITFITTCVKYSDFVVECTLEIFNTYTYQHSCFNIISQCSKWQPGVHSKQGKYIYVFSPHFAPYLINYRPQCSCSKVIFSQASVSHSVSRGCVSRHAVGQTPLHRQTPLWADNPSAQCMVGYTSLCPVHAGIHPHCCGRYASHCNAFLFH